MLENHFHHHLFEKYEIFLKIKILKVLSIVIMVRVKSGRSKKLKMNGPKGIKVKSPEIKKLTVLPAQTGRSYEMQVPALT